MNRESLLSGRWELVMGEGWVDRSKPITITQATRCHEAKTPRTAN